MKKMLQIPRVAAVAIVLMTAFAAHAADDVPTLRSKLATVRKHRDSQVAKLAGAGKFGLGAGIQKLIDNDDNQIRRLEGMIAAHSK